VVCPSGHPISVGERDNEARLIGRLCVTNVNNVGIRRLFPRVLRRAETSAQSARRLPTVPVPEMRIMVLFRSGKDTGGER